MQLVQQSLVKCHVTVDFMTSAADNNYSRSKSLIFSISFVLPQSFSYKPNFTNL